MQVFHGNAGIQIGSFETLRNEGEKEVRVDRRHTVFQDGSAATVELIDGELTHVSLYPPGEWRTIWGPNLSGHGHWVEGLHPNQKLNRVHWDVQQIIQKM